MEKGSRRRNRNRGQQNKGAKTKIGAKPRVMVADSWAAKGEAVVPMNVPKNVQTFLCFHMACGGKIKIVLLTA